jgi:hypothetical protein
MGGLNAEMHDTKVIRTPLACGGDGAADSRKNELRPGNGAQSSACDMHRISRAVRRPRTVRHTRRSRPGPGFPSAFGRCPSRWRSMGSGSDSFRAPSASDPGCSDRVVACPLRTIIDFMLVPPRRALTSACWHVFRAGCVRRKDRLGPHGSRVASRRRHRPVYECATLIGPISYSCVQAPVVWVRVVRALRAERGDGWPFARVQRRGDEVTLVGASSSPQCSLGRERRPCHSPPSWSHRSSG